MFSLIVQIKNKNKKVRYVITNTKTKYVELTHETTFSKNNKTKIISYCGLGYKLYESNIVSSVLYRANGPAEIIYYYGSDAIHYEFHCDGKCQKQIIRHKDGSIDINKVRYF